jgi:nuclear GTP-binding protein
VPNNFPFKEQVLAEREELRRRRQEEREKKRKGIVEEEGEKSVGEVNGTNGTNGTNGFLKGVQVDSDEEVDEDELMEEDDEEGESEGEEEAEEWEDEDQDEEDEEDEEMIEDESSDSEWGGIESDEEVSDVDILTLMNTARNSKVPPYVKAITRSDLLVFVLDARAPEITRSLEIEDFAEKKSKNCIFVLNRAGTFFCCDSNCRINSARDNAGLD